MTRPLEAMFGLVAKCRKLQLPIDISIKLFDSVIKPTLIYGCEIWVYQYCDPEKVRYKVIGGEMKGMESSMKLVALGATQRKG